jgi:DNA polymerase III subunit delta'
MSSAHTQAIRGHGAVAERFRRALERGRLASSFLFVGPAGIGKRAFALQLAQALLCERATETELAPCGACPSCRQVAGGNHPDVSIIEKPADKAFIPVELFIGDAEHRMQSGLCSQIALKPFSGRRKIAIIDDADYLNKEGANSLLKTLEEPPPKSLLILIGTSEQRQLPTIRSRCQVIRFRPLAEHDVAEILLSKGFCEDSRLATSAAAESQGSIERAQMWLDSAVLDFRKELFAALASSDANQQETAKLVSQFVDAAGKESAVKRQRLRHVASMAAEFYRAVLVFGQTNASQAESETEAMAVRAASWMNTNEGALACLELCEKALGGVDANANQATLIEWWLDELAIAARTGGVAV